MLHKLKQRTTRWQFTPSNRLPARNARQFLINEIRHLRIDQTSPGSRTAMALLRWRLVKSYHKEDRIANRAACFISGRARGTSQRFTVSRVKIKMLSDEGRLFGVRKSSW